MESLCTDFMKNKISEIKKIQEKLSEISDQVSKIDAALKNTPMTEEFIKIHISDYGPIKMPTDLITKNLLLHRKKLVSDYALLLSKITISGEV